MQTARKKHEEVNAIGSTAVSIVCARRRSKIAGTVLSEKRTNLVLEMVLKQPMINVSHYHFRDYQNYANLTILYGSVTWCINDKKVAILRKAESSVKSHVWSEAEKKKNHQ